MTPPTGAHARGVRAASVGDGALCGLPTVGTIDGAVVATYRHGCYVRWGSTLIAVGAIPPGPIHIVVREPLVVRIDDHVVASVGRLLIDTVDGRAEIDLASPPRWSAALPTGDAALRAASALAALPDGAPSDLTTVWRAVAAAVGACELESAARLLEGRGPGSTPIGDDVLAGLLLVDALLRPERAARRAATAAGVRTTDLSRAFLRWAAVGQSIEPVHTLLTVAAGRRSTRDTVAEAVADVVAIGASSGAALVAGLRLGARSLPAEAGESAPCAEALTQVARETRGETVGGGSRLGIWRDLGEQQL